MHDRNRKATDGMRGFCDRSVQNADSRFGKAYVRLLLRGIRIADDRKGFEMQKKNIGVIFGGCSPEYGVSLESAHAVVSHMDKTKYQPVMIGISQAGDWFYYTGPTEKIEEDTWLNGRDCIPAAISPNRSDSGLFIFQGDGVRKIRLDAVFPVLHGKNGEDGTVQGAAELAGIPLVGCGVLSSALCMDKDRAHRLVQAAGVDVAAAVVIDGAAEETELKRMTDKLRYPLFVKPVKAGSSYGITKVSAPEDLFDAVVLALEYDDQVIIEENICGFEVGCAVLGNRFLKVGEVDEIELSDGFFDFTEKYTLKTSAIHVPARISRAKAEEVKETAQVIYRTLGCRGFARVDMFLAEDGRIVFNEVNTIPGFTAHSRYPNMMKACGMSFEEIISSVIELAVSE